MSEVADITNFRRSGASTSQAGNHQRSGTQFQRPRSVTSRTTSKPNVFFDRKELWQIMSIYGDMVQKGEWRDYAIDDGKDACVFSIYRRSSEMPIYRVEKRPKLASRQGAFSVMSASGQVLKRGHDLKNTLSVFDTRKFRLVAVD